MIPRFRCVLVFLIFLASVGAGAVAAEHRSVRALLLTPAQATAKQLKQVKSMTREGLTGAVLYLDDRAEEEDHQEAARRILDAGLKLYYWIEIGRCSTLADAQPQWMASLQTHTEWRRHFPKFPNEKEHQVVKNYPWVPVMYREAFEAHLERVELLLENLPQAAAVFLNDLQGAPSACGCGNSSCRWTADYGPKTTATRLEANAAALFVVSARRVAGGAEVIPVWTAECAEQEHESQCGGVTCFTGACWKEYARQIEPVARQAREIGVLLTQREAAPATALASFKEVLPKNGGPVIDPARLVAVVPAGAPKAVEQQLDGARQAGLQSWIIALAKIDQSWEPRLMDLPGSAPK